MGGKKCHGISKSCTVTALGKWTGEKFGRDKETARRINRYALGDEKKKLSDLLREDSGKVVMPTLLKEYEKQTGQDKQQEDEYQE